MNRRIAYKVMRSPEGRRRSTVDSAIRVVRRDARMGRCLATGIALRLALREFDASAAASFGEAGRSLSGVMDRFNEAARRMIDSLACWADDHGTVSRYTWESAPEPDVEPGHLEEPVFRR